MPRNPTDAEVIEGAINTRLDHLHTATVAKVMSYDPVTQTCVALPVMHTPVEDKDGAITYEPSVPIPDIPVVQPRTLTHFVHLPLAPGDHVLLVSTSESIAVWRETGSVSRPGDLRRHHLGSTVAIPGVAHALQPLTDLPLPGMDPTEAVFGGGVWRFGGKATADFVALAAKVDAIFNAIAGVTPAAGDGGATIKAAVVAALTAIGGSVACANVKAEPPVI